MRMELVQQEIKSWTRIPFLFNLEERTCHPIYDPENKQGLLWDLCKWEEKKTEAELSVC